ncbi:hypothetical protein [Streptomyces sp900116325]|uniref:hypothetical protein n=1 Tax=Streptomyces sp. 900116325 TaxID=3154295 RepID=UPI0033FC2D26
MRAGISHFHCPDCHPTLQRGITPAVCGQIIPEPIEGKGWAPKCPGCKSALRKHKASHR